MNTNLSDLTLDDATKLLIRWLRAPDHVNYSKYGYDIYLPSLITDYLNKSQTEPFEKNAILTSLSPLFYNAAWELCRRGIIRPGISRYGSQSTDDGNAGNGYSITSFGYQWLQEKSNNDFVPTEPERFAQMIEPYKEKFGTAFHQRVQEAIRCYGAHAYLACCAMCGAAAESILLGTAIAKTHDETEVLKRYRSTHGRRNIENILTGQANQQLKNEMKGFNSLLKYWRDDAAHGHISNINENVAYTAISMLLRFAMFVDDRWEELTI